MKKGDKPSNLDPAWWESHKTKGFVEDPKSISLVEVLCMYGMVVVITFIYFI